MIGLIIGSLVFLFPIVAVFCATIRKGWELDDVLFGCFLTAIASGIVGIPIGFCGLAFQGLGPNYSSGERMGFITKASTKGMIFVTNEIDIQVGSGQMASLQPQHEMSVPNQAIFDTLKDSLGRRSRWARQTTKLRRLNFWTPNNPSAPRPIRCKIRKGAGRLGIGKNYGNFHHNHRSRRNRNL